ncbi:hypothetical protein BD289DRAFT_445051 [Coniella lustricola]|uniref:Uncharacterized protein n=1 Tax=Coniella lustricola TaxID=2025994 RepID=A0A2T2ZV85_9PEZI|nr:hypothetical protein BD289DRAFT_445051 [Coniella lustricola]
MTAAGPVKDGSPLSSSASFETPQWPLRDHLVDRQLDEDARAAGLPTEPDERQQPASVLGKDQPRATRPWWKTRKVLIAYAVAAVLVVVAVVLLALGLLGYLRKVGPFSHLFSASSSSSSSSSSPPNPLSTIPLMADPYATPSSSASISGLVGPTPTSLPASTTTAVRTQFLSGA